MLSHPVKKLVVQKKNCRNVQNSHFTSEEYVVPKSAQIGPNSASTLSDAADTRPLLCHEGDLFKKQKIAAQLGNMKHVPGARSLGTMPFKLCVQTERQNLCPYLWS
jgi:hypothetical protein